MQGQISIFDGTPQSMLNKSLELIKAFEEAALKRNPRGYVVCYSGGKDSDVLVHLFRRVGVKFCVVHNHTTLDAPETVYYIRKKFKEWEAQGIPCKIYFPSSNFWSVCLQKKFLPSRQARFCCEKFKEADIAELYFSLKSFGVRKAESFSRSLNRDSIETRNNKGFSDIQKFHFDNTDNVKLSGACYKNNYFFINPLAYWADDYEQDYIEAERIELNPLYSEGFNRVGCIGCPLASIKDRIKEFNRYPKFKERFIKLAGDILQARAAGNKPNKFDFKSGEEYFEYWLTEKLYQTKSNETLLL